MGKGDWSYDLIAEVYETDMGRSMRFDDIDWYLQQCQRRGGRVLELGCGTGRILLPLLAAGIDIVGIDRSQPMLQRLLADARRQGLSPRVACMDLSAPGFSSRFDLMLAPYSLVTYLLDDDAVRAWLDAAWALLTPCGELVVDAFIPRPHIARDAFTVDYTRSHEGGQLERSKRIQALADGCHRIERRYRLSDANGHQKSEFTTVDVIRPRTPEALCTLLLAQGFKIRTRTWDYTTMDCQGSPQFHSIVCVKP